MQKINITTNDAGKRIDKFLTAYYDIPYSQVMKKFRKKDVRVNGKKIKDSSYILRLDDEIITYFAEVAPKTGIVAKTSKQDFAVIYEDENILVVDKPHKLVIHSPDEENLNDQVHAYLIKKGYYAANTSFEPAAIQRLDKATRGIVIYAKNYPTLRQLLDVITDKTHIRKEYKALLEGNIKREFEINSKLTESKMHEKMIVSEKGLSANTIVTPEKFDGRNTRCNIRITTGRKHQIRVHCASVGHPIVGDYKYGKRGPQMRLVSYKTSFSNFKADYQYFNNLVFEIRHDL